MSHSPTLSTSSPFLAAKRGACHAHALAALAASASQRQVPAYKLSQAPLPWGERTLPADAPASKLLLKVEEAAHLLSLSRKTIYDLMRRGELASLKIGGSRRIPLTALHDFIARLEAVA